MTVKSVNEGPLKRNHSLIPYQEILFPSSLITFQYGLLHLAHAIGGFFALLFMRKPLISTSLTFKNMMFDNSHCHYTLVLEFY